MSLILLTFAVALILILGLIVDGGAKARAIDHAGAIAAQAARAAAGTVTPGETDVATADRAARDYLTAAGAGGTVAVDGTHVTVTATLHAKTAFLSLIGIDSFTVTGVGRADTVYSPGSSP